MGERENLSARPTGPAPRVDEILAALEREAVQANEGFVRTREIAQVLAARGTPRSIRWIRERIQPLIELGVVESRWIPARDMNGRATLVPAYRLSKRTE